MRDATWFLEKAAETQKERGKVYDGAEKERSMSKIVSVFNTITGRNLKTSEGWLFMIALKLVRGSNVTYHEDSELDGVAYFSLHAEEKSIEKDAETKV